MSEEYRFSVQVIRVYHVWVEADSKEEAYQKAERMLPGEIEEKGKLRLTETDYVEEV